MIWCLYSDNSLLSQVSRLKFHLRGSLGLIEFLLSSNWYFFAPFGLISHWSTAYPLLPHSWFFQLYYSRPSSPLIPSIICQKRLFGRDTSLLLLYYDIKLSNRSVRSCDRRMIKKGMSPTHGLLWGKKIDSNIYIYIYIYIGYLLIFWQAPLYEGPSLIANSTATG